MIQNTPPYWSHIALETASNLGFAKIARYQGLSESQDFLNLLLAFRTMCGMAQEMLLKWSNNNKPQSMQASHTHDNCEYIDSKGNCDLRL